MKKIMIFTFLVFIVISACNIVLANNDVNTDILDSSSRILEIKEESKSKIDEYTEKYGSESYGLTAYILNTIRIYSIPACFVGIAIGAIMQYAIGTRRLDFKQKGFALILSFVTILVICQVLPLIYTLVVIGWRG